MTDRDLGLGQLETTVIEDRLAGDTSVTGIKIADISTQRRDLSNPKPRWGHNRVWKLAGGGYVLAQEAYSLTYHTPGTRCRTANQLQSGEQVSATMMGKMIVALGYLLEDAVSCDICQPDDPEYLEPEDLVRYETPRIGIHQCDDVGQVIHELTTSRKFSGVRTQEIPEPTRALLEQCRRHDPDWASGPRPVTVIR